MEHTSNLFVQLNSFKLDACNSFSLRAFGASSTPSRYPFRLNPIGDRMKDRFLDKVETDVAGREVSVGQLASYALDQAIRSSLPQGHELPLCHFVQTLAILTACDYGKWRIPEEKGVIAYVSDEMNEFWALRAGWDIGSSVPTWNLYAFSPLSDCGWSVGDCILS